MEEETLIPEPTKNVLNKVTPFSKALAATLFTTLPFIGVWVGYLYAPSKIVGIEKVIIEETTPDFTDSYYIEPRQQETYTDDVEIEKVIIEETTRNFTDSDIDPGQQWTYKDDEFGFEFTLPARWKNMTIKKEYFPDSVGASFLISGIRTNVGISGDIFSSSDLICNLVVFTNENWEEIISSPDPVFLSVITQNEVYTYTHACGHDDAGFKGFEEFNSAVDDGDFKSINSGEIIGPYLEFRTYLEDTFILL